MLDSNVSAVDGGALWADGLDMTLTVRDSVISGNEAISKGGGIYIGDTGGTLTIERTTISGNTAGDEGGGIYFYEPDDDVVIVASTISGNSAGDQGGGIFMYNMTLGDFTIDSSTISGNSSSGSGGGIFFDYVDNPTLIINSTVSGNSSTGGNGGGIGMFYAVADMMVIAHSTIVENDADISGGNLWLYQSADVFHSVVADGVAPIGADIESAVTVDANYSLIEDASGLTLNGTGNITDTDPELGALADNGGSTRTHLPSSSSPLINAGDPAISGPPAFDQRGAVRITGAAIDIGAVESGFSPVNDVGVTAEDTPLNVAAPGVLANDPGATSAVLVTPPVSGVVMVNADGSYVYTPNANFNGTDSFTYEAFAAGFLLGIATVNLTISPVDDLSSAANDVGATAEDTPLTVAAPGVLANDPGATSAVLVTLPVSGAVMVNADGSYTYTPTANFNGTDSFTYEAFAAGVSLGIATVNLTISPVQDLPRAVNDTAAVVVGGTVTIQVLGNDSDIDGDTLTIAAVTQGSKGTVTIVGATVVYRPNLNASGTDSFTYTITDGVNSVSATVTVTLAPGIIPSTGSEHGGELVLAAGLMLAGGALTVGTRRRRAIAP